MIKRIIVFFVGVAATVLIVQQAAAADLWQVYQQALKSDPTYQAAIATQMNKAEAVPLNLALLLPQLNFDGKASASKSEHYTNTPTQYSKYNASSRGYEYELKLTQTIFDITNWKNLAAARNSVRAANAAFNAASQSLMQRTTSAYFAVLQSQEKLRYTKANKNAVYQQYMQAFQGYKVGVKTITDVYQARAQYEGTVSQYISAKNDLANKFEDLRAITGVLYKKLTPLKDNLPLINPQPNNIDKWVDAAIKQNWELIAARYTALAAHDTITAKQGGHLPTANLFAEYGKTYADSFSRGKGYTVTNPAAGIEFKMPILAGGGVSAAVRQAIANYEYYSQQQEKTYRNTVNQTRQSYLGVLTGISTIKSNRRAVVANKSSLRGTQEEYKVGTQTMVDVLLALEKLYEAQKTYVNSRYDYINSLINLKLSAGTLSTDDLVKVNSWLRYAHTRRGAVKKRRVVRAASKPIRVKAHKVHKAHKLSKDYEYVQVGAYSTLARANKVAHLVHNKTKLSFIVSPVKRKTGTLYRVRIGPVHKKDVDKLIKQLHSL